MAKSVKGFLATCRKLIKEPIQSLKGYDDLTEEKQYMVGVIKAGIENDLGEYDRLPKGRVPRTQF